MLSLPLDNLPCSISRQAFWRNMRRYWSGDLSQRKNAAYSAPTATWGHEGRLTRGKVYSVVPTEWETIAQRLAYEINARHYSAKTLKAWLRSEISALSAIHPSTSLTLRSGRTGYGYGLHKFWT